MAEEKILTLNLRKEVIKYPKWKRNQKFMAVLRQEIVRRTKTKKIKIDKNLNEKIWKGGTPTNYTVRVKLNKETNGSVSVKAV